MSLTREEVEHIADLARLGLRAMCAGALASWLTATIAGMLTR